MSNNMDLGYDMFSINVNRQPAEKAALNSAYAERHQK